MNEEEFQKILSEKEQIIKDLKQDIQYWRNHYSNILDAYFRLHTYCHEINLENKQYSQ